MKEYLEQRIAVLENFTASSEISKICFAMMIEEFQAALSHLNNIKEE